MTALRAARSGGKHLLGFAARCLAPAVIAIIFSGCATSPDPKNPEAVAEFERFNDPAEPAMRAIFGVNMALDSVILKPAAKLYKDVMPDVAKQGVFNFLNNLRSPVIFVNDVLQGELARAGTTLARFLINSTVGILGFADQATGMGLPYHNEDFGQTMTVWGVPEGMYIVLPVFGPSNPRDAVGLAVDFLVDPINWWSSNTSNEWVPFARSAARAVDERARIYDLIEDLQKNSLDFYAAVRSLYRQRRADAIRNGVPSANMPAPGIGVKPKFPDKKPAREPAQAP
jgi:phospholipid-binding lipoprotein MlaA